jgi:Uncharacterized protein conserved in bacteria (DUF2169)
VYVRNRTTLLAALCRGSLTDELSVGAIVISTAYAVGASGLTLLEAPPPPAQADPPDMSRHVVVRGCSVTAAGTVFGPSGPPFVKGVTFRIGAEQRRLAVFGERRWRADLLGELAPSEPQRFEALPLSFDHAFGGSFVLPPGLMPGTSLPHPGGKVPYPLNDHGIGFYPDRASATGARLPLIELADRLVSRWSDRPVPGGFSPCPELPALRHLRVLRSAPVVEPGAAPPPEVVRDLVIDGLLVGPHHAPGYLIFDALPAGTPIELVGAGKEPVRFELPAPPARVTTRRGGDLRELTPAARSVHVDADRRTVRCVHACEFAYKESTAPSWIVIEAAGG